MQVKLLTSMAGDNFDYRYGQVVDLPQAEARRLIKAGAAEPVRSEPAERAVKASGEKAVRRPARKG